ncbi:diacylglycerol kinase family lipid kinase [Glycomyces sp. TRM65418]|uniref:diacylglycerol/lipid kinase family protein n=1 Tax=Glycomyces sp. TRM65418 TaxID=2867006 RepID=UPI001CE5B29E|nr:diacylglycerol kinase family protein [Glycomyces sp. TRM65418]MCC3762397.1 diacylglycerol kinase family lipid kinase [Glycomyces sp. TRM65418]QZD56442.1 diacylglycerol kinase family lipid kinase [Glycomyces sp. TRM65418]
MRDLKAAPQRGLLIVNPKASTGSRRRTRWVAKKLGDVLDLDVQLSGSRGHGEELAKRGAGEGYDVVVSLGGDGTVNEVVNGLLADGRDAADAPIFAPIPAGSTNVFARALGLPWDRRRASMAIVAAIEEQKVRTVNLGRAKGDDIDRLFTFCAGLGWDASIIKKVESYRKKRNLGAHYARAVMAELNEHGVEGDTIEVELSEGGEDLSEGMVVVQNCAPWTYLGTLPVNLNARASFNAGLDVLILRKLGLSDAARTAASLLVGRDGPDGKHAVTHHDLSRIRLRASLPQAFQLDGDYLGERTEVELTSVPAALRVAC